MIQKTGIDNFKDIYWLRDQDCAFGFSLAGIVGWFYDTSVETKTEEYGKWREQLNLCDCGWRFYINVGFVI